MEKKQDDMLEFIMAFEGGDLTDEELIEGFQRLIDNGMAWSLQGVYGRTAMSLIEQGHCHHKEEEDNYKRCADISPYDQCNDPQYECFEYEEDYEEGTAILCRHCLVRSGRGYCEQAKS